MLLSSDNVNQEALQCYAREAADFGTNYQLPTLDYALNHCGQPDVAMFDFTSMHASENAALVRERFGHQLLVALVGDSLLEVRKEDSVFLCSCRFFFPHIFQFFHICKLG